MLGANRLASGPGNEPNSDGVEWRAAVLTGAVVALVGALVAGVWLIGAGVDGGTREAEGGAATAATPSMNVIGYDERNRAENSEFEAREPKREAAIPDPPPAARVDHDSERPAWMPCRAEVYWSKGDLQQWFSFKYERGRLVAARNESVSERQAIAGVDADLESEPWGISYEYDDAGRLVVFRERLSSDGRVKTTTFNYDRSGVLTGYSYRLEQFIEHHKVKVSSRGAKTARVEEETFSMFSVPMTVRFEYDEQGPPWRGKQIVLGRSLEFGANRSYFQMQGKPETLMAVTVYAGPGGGISNKQAYHADGTRAERTTYVYDCSTPIPWAP